MQTNRWQDWINLLLGAWLFASPWLFDYRDALPRAAWNAYLIGAAILVFAAIAVRMPKAWEEWINTVFGIWLTISPWLLEFETNKGVTTNFVIVGILVTALAVWAMIRDQGFQNWWHDHHRHAI